MNDKPLRRRFQFSLRTMFVGITLVSIPLAWVGYQLNWIRQRRMAIRDERLERWWKGGHVINAPGWLSLFGEGGIQGINYHSLSCKLSQEELSRLFPESEITDMDRYRKAEQQPGS